MLLFYAVIDEEEPLLLHPQLFIYSSPISNFHLNSSPCYDRASATWCCTAATIPMVVASLEGCDKWISKLFRSYPLLQTPWVSLHSWCSIFTYALRLMSWEHVDKYVKQTWGQTFAILHIQLRTWNVWASHSGQSGISSPNRKQTQAVTLGNPNRNCVAMFLFSD